MKMSLKRFVAGAIILLSLVTACSMNRSDKKTVAEAPLAPVADSVKIGLEPGFRAPELAFSSPDGKTISLSDYRGKVVLIDFWASWCMPCRVENPNLVRIYNTFKDKQFVAGDGFTIFSVSLDKEMNSWTEAIRADGLVWEAHVSDLKGWYAVPAAMYQVSSIPSNFLIDGNGVILAKNLRDEALEKAIRSLLKGV